MVDSKVVSIISAIQDKREYKILSRDCGSMESIIVMRSSKATKSGKKESGANKKQIKTKTKLEKT